MADLNASDRKSIRAAEKAAAFAERERGVILTTLMDSQSGRRFFWDKLAAAGVFQTSFSTDPIQMAFNEGQRNQGLLLLNDIIQWCPDQFIQAMRESNERNTSSRTATGSGNLGERPSGEDAGGDDQGPGDGDPFALPGSGDGTDEAVRDYR